MNFTPKFSGYKQKVYSSFEAQKFMELLGAQLTVLEPGFCQIEVPYKDSLTQQNGYFHAGVIGTIADNTAGYAAFSLMEEKASILTVEYKINLIAPAKGDKLIGKGQVVKSGRTLSVCTSELFSVSKGVENLCAVSQSTLISLLPKS
ncbi:MAG: PaaI family thioesterase [Flavobacteriaceae bacterium]|nr:PaaI family thioesterase [Flavobacteriaceae bacterium]